MTHPMNRRSFLGLGATALLALSGCGNDQKDGAADDAAANGSEGGSSDSGKLIVFAAASLTESLEKAGDQFKEKHPGVDITYNFDSSGTLKTQIQEGAQCDVFISAGQKQMDQLDAKSDSDANPDGLDHVMADTRFDILENKVTLSVPEDNPESLSSFEQMAEKLKTLLAEQPKAASPFLALGNSDVPVGQYSTKILTYLGLDEKALADAGYITYGSNVKEVTTQVKEGAVPAGIIYATDAHSADLKVVATATEEMCGRVVYPAAVMKDAPDADLAKEFLEFLKGPEASEDFEEVGFTPLAETN